MNREGSKRHWKLYPLRIAGYVLLFVVMVVLYFFFKSYVVASLVWLLVLLPVVSIWLNWKMTPYLTVRISALQPKVIAGEESRFMCKLSNAFPWVSLQCELQGTIGNTLYHTEDLIRLCLPVCLRGEEAMELPFRCKYSGNLQFCIHTLAIKDLLGFVSVQQEISEEAAIAVMPQETGDASEQKSGFQMGMSELEESQAKGNDFAEITDVREYRPGDRIKDIHWKLSAKKETLMVKERTSVAQSQVVLVLDLSGQRDTVEEVLGLAYGLSKLFLKEYTPVRLLVWDALEYDFIEVLIQKREEIDTQFIYLLRRAVVTDNIELAKMVQSLRPQLQAYAVIGLYEDGVRGEVISHG